MYDSDSSARSDRSSSSRLSRTPWIDEPVTLTRIDQISQKASLSSFAYKADPIHAHILNLLYDDPVTDMVGSTRRGLANNLLFLIMRDMHDAVEAQRVVSAGIDVLYQYDKLQQLHRAMVKITDTANDETTDDAESVFMEGEWVQDQSQALESLRKAVEAAIYGTT